MNLFLNGLVCLSLFRIKTSNKTKTIASAVHVFKKLQKNCGQTQVKQLQLPGMLLKTATKYQNLRHKKDTHEIKSLFLILIKTQSRIIIETFGHWEHLCRYGAETVKGSVKKIYVFIIKLRSCPLNHSL